MRVVEGGQGGEYREAGGGLVTGAETQLDILTGVPVLAPCCREVGKEKAWALKLMFRWAGRMNARQLALNKCCCH